ncbi:hypothetical protein [Prevotella sp.]|uniref:hypothetical protein n=1 Tax=Prevotella sp. TaxID=59823 RepID=UPI0025F5C550|nr:hypothetical protein [Prevotella sp.]
MDKIESIYEKGQTTQQPKVEAQQPVPTQQPLSMKPLKAEKSVKVTIPMDYYFRLARLKECTGKTLQELAAQGVIEFIDRYSQG